MSVVELLQAAQFVVDSDGKRQAVQLNLKTWQELLALLTNVEEWEQAWSKPFEAVRAAWETSSPAPEGDHLPDDNELVRLIHQARETA